MKLNKEWNGNGENAKMLLQSAEANCSQFFELAVDGISHLSPLKYM